MKKVPSHVMLVLANVTKESSNERERERERERKESLNVTKSIVTYDVGTTQ